MSKSRHSLRAGVISLLALLLLGALGGVAWAPPSTSNKLYQGFTTPDSIAALTQQEFTLSLTNDTDNPGQLGSANVFQPASDGTTINMSFDQITQQPKIGTNLIVGASAEIKSGPPRIELRNLSLAQGDTMTIKFKATAPCFSGSGDWVVFPKQANNWSGPPGNNIQPDPAEGAVDFGITVTGSCFQDPGTGLTVTVVGDFSGPVVASFGGTLDCSGTTTDPNEPQFLHLPVQFNLDSVGTPGVSNKTVTFRFTQPEADAGKDSSWYRICYHSDHVSFTDIDGDTVFTGYLPDCVTTSPPITANCTKEQYRDFDTNEIVIVTIVKPQDEKWR